MEEILGQLIKTTLKSGPQNKQFYSNLSTTKSIHDHAEIQSRLQEAITYLQSQFSPTFGFQSKFYTGRDCNTLVDAVYNNSEFPIKTCEILTSVIALDLLYNSLEDNDRSFNIGALVEPNIQNSLQGLIVPNSGLGTFQMFKLFEEPNCNLVANREQEVLNLIEANVIQANNDEQEFDSGNDSPTPVLPEIEKFNLPEDLNITSLALFALLQQGILHRKPAESVVLGIISKKFTFKEDQSLRPTPSLGANIDSLESNSIFKSEKQDPVTLVNFLNLLYLLDISHEELLNEIEEFLIMTLKNAIKTESLDPSVSVKPSASCASFYHDCGSGMQDANVGNYRLGNPPAMATSDMICEQKGSLQWESFKEAQQQSLVLFRHNAPEPLIYFLSRSFAINEFKATTRPNITEMKTLLIDLLDIRLGTSTYTCDLAMRILSGCNLGIIMMQSHRNWKNNSSNTDPNENCNIIMDKCLDSVSVSKLLRMNNLLRKEFELLVSLQNEVDGYWPADSIIQMSIPSFGIPNSNFDYRSFCGQGYENDHIYEHNMGYLGGTELSTVFAIKAIIIYLAAKKDFGVFGKEKAKISCRKLPLLEVHHLY